MSKVDLNAIDSSSALVLVKWLAESINTEIEQRDKRIEELEFKLNLLNGNGVNASSNKHSETNV